MERFENSDKIPNRGIMFIDEPGIYALVMSSKLKTAKEFQDWLYEEVLPSIRKHGMYIDTTHPRIRAMNIAIREMETHAISRFIKYARKKGYNEDKDLIYAKLSNLANRFSDIETGKRDKTGTINLCMCIMLETKIMSTIYDGIIEDLSPDTVMAFCYKNAENLVNEFNYKFKENEDGDIEFKIKNKIINQHGDKLNVSLKVEDDNATFKFGNSKIEFEPEIESIVA